MADTPLPTFSRLLLAQIWAFKHFPCKSKLLAETVKSCASDCLVQSACLIGAQPLNVVSA